MLFFKKKQEKRADLGINMESDDLLLSALLGTTAMTKTMVANIPSLVGCIEYIANCVAMLPIKLYKENDGKTKEIRGDPRLKLLNDDTKDTLDAVQFWKAMINDYFLGKGGYAYINRQKNECVSLHYVDELNVSIIKNQDPIFKDYDVLINAQNYKPYDFLKLLRKTKDGCIGQSIITESPLLMSVAYNSLVFEKALMAKGGNKKGFLKSQKKLTQDAIDALKTAWKNLYGNNEENVVVLNDGLDFQESSNTSVEMQMNENKVTNSAEICKLFNVPESIIKGNASEKDYVSGFKLAVMPILRMIECALNKDMLLESEKDSMYFAFDTKEITKGDIKTRYEAYKLGIDSNFLQIDEARYYEDLEPLGLDWIKLSLDSVLYDPKTKDIYVANTGEYRRMSKDKTEIGGGKDENRNQS